jgi:hypothetical protein
MSDWTWADVEAEVQPRTETVDLCLDGTIQARLDDARRRLREARRDDALDAGSTDLQAEVDALEEEAERATRTFDVVACGHKRWRELLVSHRSDNPEERYNAETFVPAAIAECVPQFTDAGQVVKAQEMLTTGQITKLFGAVRKVNEGDDQVPSSRGR